MRRWLMLGALLLLIGGLVSAKVWADSLIQYSDGMAPENVDDIRKYVRVRNTDQAATTLVDGDVVVWDLRSGTNTSLDNRWSVTTTTIAGHPAVAGAMTESTAPNRYGYLQVSGIHAGVRTTGLVEPDQQVLETSTTRGRAQGAADPDTRWLGAPLERQASGDQDTHTVITVGE